MNKFYLTAAIPYVNAKPHIGHALEFVQADVIKRFKKLQGLDTLLLSGADENALKNVQAAEKEGILVQELVDQYSNLFQELTKNLNIEFDVWQKGSSPNHHKASQKLWELCDKNGDIYKKTYTGLYCVGCEQFYEKDELNENGECFEHPGKKLDEVSEENYFFKLSNYQKQIEELLESDKIKIIPTSRKTEVLNFVKQGLQDISISRTNNRAKDWGVSVPNDNTQKIYVWFDALNIYQSGVGFATDEKKYKKWWPADLHVIGKGILRFHAVYWPAFLLSAKLPLPKSIFVHGYFTVNGQKMSKSLGNVIDPNDMIKKYGTDTLRFYLLREIPSTSDGDFSEVRLAQVYNSELANGLGNLVSRIAKLCQNNNFTMSLDTQELPKEYETKLNEYKFNEVLEGIWKEISEIDKSVNDKKPWEIKDEKILKDYLSDVTAKIYGIALKLRPFIPETADRILKQFEIGKPIKSGQPLFPRI